MFGAFSQLVHNGNLVRQAEETLNELLDGSTNTYLYIENPDGTRIGLQYGFKIIDIEIIGLKQNQTED